jgi:hypothetical protein
MWLPASARTHAAVALPHVASVRVEVWRGDEQIGEVTGSDIAGGSVTDQWVSGVRRNLTMSVPPTRDWLTWLAVGVEIRPFRGVSFGPGDVEMCPLGRFPVRKFTKPRTASEVPVRAQDRWQRVASNTLPFPMMAYPGLVRDVVATLLGEIDLFRVGVVNTATSTASTPSGLWSDTRAKTISDLLTAIGAEAYVDRDGVPTIRDRPVTGTPVGTLRAGRGGTVTELVEEVDWESVVNAVEVFSSATDTTLEPVWVGVTWSDDPAHWSRIGGWQSTRYASPVFTSRDQMVAAGETLLLKGAAPARQWSAQVIPNAGFDASDTVWVETPDGTLELAQIQQVTHPLTAGALQSISTVSTRTGDES